MVKVVECLVERAQHGLGPDGRAECSAAGCDHDKDRLGGTGRRAGGFWRTTGPSGRVEPLARATQRAAARGGMFLWNDSRRVTPE